MARKEYTQDELLELLRETAKNLVAMLGFPDDHTSIMGVIAQTFVVGEHLHNGEEHMKAALLEARRRWDCFFQAVCQRCGGPIQGDQNTCSACTKVEHQEDVGKALLLFGDPASKSTN